MEGVTHINVAELANILFSQPPLDPCTYKVISNTNIFHPLMDLLIRGAKILYGQHITPQQMTEDQFDLLKKYMLSIGYKIKHNYSSLDELATLPQPHVINIWFEPFSIQRDCHGRIVIT
jgi:hypothetical protein